MSERPPLRLLHTSDVHLGAYDRVDNERNQKRRAMVEEMFSRVIDVGLRERVDFMVIAGDFVDNAGVRDDTLRFAAEQVARLEAPVVLVPGNHDHVGPGSVYDRTDLTVVAQNLRIMRSPEGETMRLEGLEVEIWGRSHTELDPDFAPIEGAPMRGDAPWHIGVGHGHYIHDQALMTGNFHIYREHIEPLDHDYVALGHWEVQARVAGGNVVAAYSGAPEGLAGVKRRRVLVADLERGGSVRLTSHSLADGPALSHDEIPFLEGVDRS